MVDLLMEGKQLATLSPMLLFLHSSKLYLLYIYIIIGIFIELNVSADSVVYITITHTYVLNSNV